jgi:MFS family permease
MPPANRRRKERGLVFAAAFINRYGVRKVTLCALCLIALGVALALGMNHIWQLILLWGVVVRDCPRSRLG